MTNEENIDDYFDFEDYSHLVINWIEDVELEDLENYIIQALPNGKYSGTPNKATDEYLVYIYALVPKKFKELAKELTSTYKFVPGDRDYINEYDTPNLLMEHLCCESRSVSAYCDIITHILYDLLVELLEDELISFKNIHESDMLRYYLPENIRVYIKHR